jgi:hypothetical protein
MRPFLRHSDGEWYKVQDVVTREEKDGVKKLFTTSGGEVVDPSPAAKPAAAVIPGVPTEAAPPLIKVEDSPLTPATPPAPK